MIQTDWLRMMLTALLLAMGQSLSAQQDTTWEGLFEEWCSEVADDDDEASWSDAYEQLSDLAAHPLNLNSATREELEQLPFLSTDQVEDLLEYVFRYGPVRSLAELSMIPSIDIRQRQLLRSFLYVDDQPVEKGFPTLSSIARYGHSELTATAHVPFYQRQGDRNGYLGYPYRHWLRYNYQYGQWVKAGFVASQDGGEPFFANRNTTGYDYYSYYLLLRDMGRLKTLALGRYRLRFGMGLIMNSDFSLGKVAQLQTIDRQTNTVRAHSSRSEANYLQGAAATLDVGRGFEVTAFASRRPIDATLTGDDIATILTTGYHRTESEMARKHNASQSLYGGHVGFSRNGFRLGATAYTVAFNRPLSPNTQTLYRRYYPEGTHFWNASADYGYTSHRLTVSGETATGDSHAWATLHTATLRISSSLTAVALQRFYSYRYTSLFARSFAANTRVQNESGAYLGLQWQTSRYLTLSAYTDYAYHPWARYLVSQPSTDWDHYLAATYNRGRLFLLARARLRFRQRDNLTKTGLQARNEQRLRFSAGYADDHWQLRAQADLAFAQFRSNSFGSMITGQAAYQRHRLQIASTLGLFNTDDYESRIYSYERGPLYTLGFPMFYGRGFRSAAFLKWEVSKKAHFIGKVSNTHYFDRSHIGAGLQQIDGRNQPEADLQIRLKF